MSFDPGKSTRKWLRQTGARDIKIDNPAYDRMAEALLDALNAAGGEDHNFEKYFALVKAISMIIGSVTFDEQADTARQWCLDLGEEVVNQVQTFRLAAARDILARRNTNG